MTRSLARTLSLTLSFLAPGSLQAQTAGPSAAAYLTFDEGAGATAADASGNQHAATLLGATGWTAGLVGPSALAVPGTPGSYA